MASDEFGHAAKQETLDASLSMRTNDDQIGTPLGCGIDDSLSDVTYLDGGVHLVSTAMPPGANLVATLALHVIVLPAARDTMPSTRPSDMTGS